MGLTREEAEIAMRKGVVNNEDYIQSLNKSKDIIKQIFDDHEAELEEVQETIKNLKHNYDVQVEYNNTAYKNYINMINSLEQRIAELLESK